MNNRHFKFTFGSKEYIYYGGASGYILNPSDDEDEYFIPPIIRDIIINLPTEEAQKLLKGIITIYQSGIEKGRVKFQKEIKNTLKLLLDLED